MMQSLVAKTTGIIGVAYDFRTTAKKIQGNDFDLYLDNSVRGKDNFHTVEKTKTASDRLDTSKNKPLSASKESKNLQIGKDGLAKKNKAKDKLDNADTSSAELILRVFDQIQSIIMEELNLTPEEFDSMMTEMGVTLTDLSEPQVIMEMLLNDKGLTDSTELLLDEELQNTFQKLLASVENIKQQLPANMSNEDIKQILTQITEQNDTVEFDFLADSYENQEAILNDSDMTKDISESKTKSQAQQLISEDSGKSNMNQGIAATDNNGLTNTNKNDFTSTNDLSATKNSDGRAEIEGFEAFVDNLTTNYDKPIVEFTDDNIRFYDIRDIAQQLIDKIRIMAKPGQTTMELQLYPEHLGKVNLTVTSKEGLMSAQFVVQNEMAKEAVESQMIILKENLAEQGIKVDSIDVTVGGYTFDQNEQSAEDSHTTRKKADRGRKITFEEAVAMSEDPIDTESSDNIIGTLGNSINYKA